MRDNASFFVELLGEEINTKVSVLTGLGGRGDTDDLAWSVLEDNQVTNADVVAWDGEGGGTRLVCRGNNSARLVFLVWLVGLSLRDGRLFVEKFSPGHCV